MIDRGAVVAERYEVTDVVARGRSADVFAAHDRRLGRDVTLSVLRTDDPDDHDWFLPELRARARVRHENLVWVLDGGVHDATPFVVLQRCDGPSLTDRLAHGPLDAPTTAALGRDLAAGLAHLVAHGLAHGAVRPSSVVLASDGRAVLLDPLQTGEAPPAGRSPERDVHDLGVLLGACTAGAAVDPALASLLASMTADDPDARPSAAAVHERLAALVPVPDPTATAALPATAIGGLAGPPTALLPLVARPAARRRAAFASALLALALVVGGASVLAVRGGSGGRPTNGPSQDGSTTTSAGLAPVGSVPAAATGTGPPSTPAPTTTAPRASAAPTTAAPPGTGTACASLAASLDAARAELDDAKGKGERRRAQAQVDDLQRQIDQADCTTAQR